MSEELKPKVTGEGSREIHTIVGMGGNGKTTLLRQLLAQSHRSLVFDPLGIMAPGVVLESRAQLEAFIDDCGGNPRFRAIYRPGKDEADHEGLLEEAEYFCYAGRTLEHVELYFDEVDAFYRTKDQPPELLALLNFGRNHEVTMRGVVRRPQCKLPADWMSETTRLTIFCVQNRQDLYMLEEITGIDRQEIKSLEQWEYFEVTPAGVRRAKLANPYI